MMLSGHKLTRDGWWSLKFTACLQVPAARSANKTQSNFIRIKSNYVSKRIKFKLIDVMDPDTGRKRTTRMNKLKHDFKTQMNKRHFLLDEHKHEPFSIVSQFRFKI